VLLTICLKLLHKQQLVDYLWLAGVTAGNIILTVAVLPILITAPLGVIGVDASYKNILTEGESA